jgi:hypothetical protein
MDDRQIIDLWKRGLTVQQVSKQYIKTKKNEGTKITILEAQKYVEPIIFKYQTSLMKG